MPQITCSKLPFDGGESPATHNQTIELHNFSSFTDLLSRISPVKLRHHIYLIKPSNTFNSTSFTQKLGKSAANKEKKIPKLNGDWNS